MFGEGRHPHFESLFERKLGPWLSQASYEFWSTRTKYFKSGLYYQGGMVCVSGMGCVLRMGCALRMGVCALGMGVCALGMGVSVYMVSDDRACVMHVTYHHQHTPCTIPTHPHCSLTLLHPHPPSPSRSFTLRVRCVGSFKHSSSGLGWVGQPNAC